MSHHARAAATSRPDRPPPQLRTYVLVALDDDPCAAAYARPLGTLMAATRALARAAACAIHADVAPSALRAIAAASAPAGFLAVALARDGERILSGVAG